MLNKVVTADQFIAANIPDILSHCEVQECSEFCSALEDKIKEQNNEEASSPLRIIAAICSMAFPYYNDHSDSFIPRYEGAEGRTFLPQDLTKEQAEELFIYAQSLSIDELKARIFDTLWVAKKNKDKHLAAISAIESYISVSSRLISSDCIFAVERLEKAICIAAELGSGGADQLNFALDTCKKSINLLPAAVDACHYRIMRILFERKYGDQYELGGICWDFAEQLNFINRDFELIRSFWELTSNIFATSGSKKDALAAMNNRAWSYVRQAVSANKYIIKAQLLRQAIEAFRKIDAKSGKIEILHKWLLRIEKYSTEELVELSTDTIDLTKVVSAAIQRVSNKDLREALVIFSMISSLNDPEKLKQQAIDDAKKYVLQSLFGSVIVNENGKVIANVPSAYGSSEDNDKWIHHRMNTAFDIAAHMSVFGQIEPARQQILCEHSITTEELWPIFIDCPIIPPGRHLIFTRGFSSGFNGDFLVANHLLIPQVENLLRSVVEMHGGITSSIDRFGVQKERNLNDLLDDELITDTFGKRIVFSLRTILVESTGGNFRHDLCHGLKDINYFYSHNAVYIWWLILRMCCIPLITAWIKEQQISADSKAE